MGLTVTTDHREMADVLDHFLIADPVRGTILGTLRDTLSDSAWLACDGPLLAARSSALFPVVIVGDWSGAPARELAGLIRELPGARGLAGPPPSVDAILAGAADLVGPEPRRIGQRLFRLDELTAPEGVAGGVEVAGDARYPLIEDWFVTFGANVHDRPESMRAAAAEAMAEHRCRLWIVDGEPVSVAARRAVIGGSARIGPVYTPVRRRGQGYASAVTAAVTREILGEGAVPVLFTDLANPTSNKIYQRLGYRAVEDRAMVLFG